MRDNEYDKWVELLGKANGLPEQTTNIALLLLDILRAIRPDKS